MSTVKVASKIVRLAKNPVKRGCGGKRVVEGYSIPPSVYQFKAPPLPAGFKDEIDYFLFLEQHDLKIESGDTEEAG